MKYKKANTLLLTGFAVSALFLGTFLAWSRVNAQEKSSISVYPSKENIIINPVKSQMKSILIVNSSNQQVTLKISVSDFKVVDENGKIEFYSSGDDYSAKKWLVPQYETITIPALDSKKMDYIATAVKDMPGKGYAGAIIFQKYNVKDEKTIGELFGTLITLNVLGKGITTGGIIDSFDNPALQLKDPLNFSFTIKNPSNSNLSLSGDIVFTNIFGKEVSRFKSGQLDIYPGLLRNFAFQWSDSPLFGIYVSTVNLIDSIRKDNIVSSWTLIIFLPWQKLLLAIAVLAFVVLAVMFLYKRYYKKIIESNFAKEFVIKKFKIYSQKAFSFGLALKNRAVRKNE